MYFCQSFATFELFKVFNRKGGSEMTVCNVVIMKEVIELIRQSDYFVDGELNFDLKLQKTADFLNSFGPEGLKPDEKLSDSEEKRLISRAYQDAKVWEIAETYVNFMVASRNTLSSFADAFYTYVKSGNKPVWAERRNATTHREEFISTLLQYLVNRYDLHINKAFGDRRSAPMVIIEAFRRLGYDDGATAEIYGQIRQRNLNMSSYARSFFSHKADQLAFSRVQIENSSNNSIRLFRSKHIFATPFKKWVA